MIKEGSLPPLDEYLSRIRAPGRYLGVEINARTRSWDQAQVRTCLVFPDLYEIGMSHLGLHILYHIVNSRPWALADRAYCPAPDLEQLLERDGVSLWGLETGRPISSFDMLGITLPYELSFPNIFTILHLAHIPFRSRDRRSLKHPVIIGGGSAAFNPEPVAEIFDAILIGDGEEAILEILEHIRRWKKKNNTKEKLLRALASLPGLYVPSLYRPVYHVSGQFKGLDAEDGVSSKVKRRFLSDLDDAPMPTPPLVPIQRIVHDRLGVEIARGCTRGCRFCQAGVIYRPVRERRPNTIMNYVAHSIEATGFDEVSLLSLSTGEYSCLEPLITGLMDWLRPRHVALALPSLRVGTLTPRIMEEIKSVRKTGFTMAPEAGSERLRQVINKGITEEDLLETAKKAYEAGWLNIKLYFMIGLPGETEADVMAIMELAKKIRRFIRHRGQVTVSVGTFVPKPHTPFQWEGQISIDEARKRLGLLKRQSRKGIKLKWHDPRQSYLEGVFSRGDRRLFDLMALAWKKGARLPGWSDFFDLTIFEEAARELELDLDHYLKPIDVEASLPWDHVDTGVKKEYLKKERSRAFSLESTPDCRQGKCHRCGVCDFKAIRPRVYKDQRVSAHMHKTDSNSDIHYFLIDYAKVGQARFFGHLDSIRAIERSFRRCGLRLAFSKGYHPHAMLQFEDALPLGHEVVGACFTVGLTEKVAPEEIRGLLNATAPVGFYFLEVKGPFREKVAIPRRTRQYLLWWQGIERLDAKTVEAWAGEIDGANISLDRGSSYANSLYGLALPHPWSGPGPFLNVSLEKGKKIRPDRTLQPLLQGIGVEVSSVRLLIIQV